MKKLLFLLALCVASISMNAQLLWKVTGAQLSKPSYLFGTYHIISGDFIDSIQGLPDVIQDVDAVYVEIESDRFKSPQAIAILSHAMLAPEDSTLDQLISPDGYETVNHVINKYFGAFGIDIKPFLKLKPAAIANEIVAMQMANILQTIDTNNLIDTAVENRATFLGKSAYSLETVEFQVKLLLGDPLPKQAADLLELCKADDEVNDALHELTRAYKQQELDKMLEMMENPAIGGNKEDMESLVYSRNANWKKILIPAMQKQSILVAVGAGHLPSDKGLIALLQKAGLTVEPVSLK